ncbi:MAG: nucleotide exchange factor GrpE [Candidatus Krumholzibacteriia bacterium]
MVDDKKPFGPQTVIDLQAARKRSKGGERKHSDKNMPDAKGRGSGSSRKKSRSGGTAAGPPTDTPGDPSAGTDAEAHGASETREAGGMDFDEEPLVEDLDGFEDAGVLDGVDGTLAPVPPAEGADDSPQDEPLVELERAIREPRKKSRRSTEKEYRGAERRKPSDQEVLARLLEKNEVILQLSKKNVQLEAQAKAAEDRQLRIAAEFENYRKRTRKEWELLRQQTTGEVLLEVLEVVDDFERAFSVAGNRSDDFVQGIRLIYNNMMSVLVKFGVTKMEALHEYFDPNYHMAVASIDSDDVKSNHVVEVIQEGYVIGDTVLRPAKVVIAK